MIKHNNYLTFFFTITLTLAYAQESINQLDENGLRHGVWRKVFFQTNQKRYEGTFSHGKEIDTFKFYSLSNGKSVLSATKVFNDTDSLSDVIFYTSQKKIISKGKMNGKRYIGQWVYYHKNGVDKMLVEHYNDQGGLDGERTVFFENGIIAEQVFYKNGQRNGSAKWFLENRQLLRQSEYRNDALNGKTIYYDNAQNITSEGHYSEDQKVGVWKYYQLGKLKKEIDHTKQKVIKKYK